MARVTVKVPASSVPAPATPAVALVEPTPETSRHGFSTRTLVIILIGLVVAVLVVLLVILMVQRNNLQAKVNTLASGDTAQQTQADKYNAEISKLVELPTGVKPVLKPVTDATKLSADNAFFKRAKNGDVVLLYVLSDKTVTAVLYRPTTHKVVELTSGASLNGTDTSNTTAP